MRLGARVGFDSWEELETHFRGVDFPIELALPYRVGDFLPIADRMDAVRDFLATRRIEVLSVHAAQGNLLLDAYRDWAEPAIKLADSLKANCVTFHPNQSQSLRLEAQAIALRHLRELQQGARTLVAVETFAGSRRVLHPGELVSLGLPMVLDIAHLHDRDLVLRLIREYHQKIPTVHLSAIGRDEHHLPIDDFCLRVVAALQQLDWNGGIILEYLPWHHYRVWDDLALLQRFLNGESNIIVPPPVDRYRSDQTRWGYKEPPMPAIRR